MGWFWQILGAVIGAVVAIAYAVTGGSLSIAFANGLVMVLDRLDTPTASAHLASFLPSLLGPVLAGFLLLIVLSYLLAGLLAALDPVAPSAWAPFVYLLLAAMVVAVAGTSAVSAVLAAPAAALAVLLAALAFLLGHAVLVGLGYLFAAIFAPGAGAVSRGESRWRGYLIGSNAVFNAIAGSLAYSMLLEPLLGTGASAVGIAIGALLGLVNLLATLASTSLVAGMGPGAAGRLQASIESLLGWSNWLMPMSWLVTGLGLPMFMLSWFSHCVAAVVPGLGIAPWLGAADYSVAGVRFDGPTGSMVLVGGAVGNTALTLAASGLPDLTRANGAFNMGCFVFTDSGADEETRQHEIGHGLSLASFGALFHYIGAVDENVFRAGQVWNAYAERVAQSNVVNPTPNNRTGVIDPSVTVWR